jgi:TPP-dependent trihydroxycyclohexane-1,2-dione (THcHDO) dehydratase
VVRHTAVDRVQKPVGNFRGSDQMRRAISRLHGRHGSASIKELGAEGYGAYHQGQSTVLSCPEGADTRADRTSVIYVKNDRMEGVSGYESWWDVPVAEVSESASVQEARRAWEAKRPEERTFL